MSRTGSRCSLLLCGNGPTKLHKMGRPRCPELVHIVLHFVTCVVCDVNMFGWVNFREDGKKRVENRRENWWEGCLDERERGREKWWGPAIFSLGPPQFNLSKIGRKWGRMCWTKLPFSLPWPTFCLFLLLSFRCFFVFFFFFFFFCLDKISSSLHNTYTLVLVLVFFFFFLDKILHSRHWFFLFVFICFFFLISF